MTAPIVEAFSVTHAAILDGTVGAEVAPLYGVRDGTLEVDSDSYNNTGDDAIQSVWNWFNLATLTISSGFIPFSTISLLTGAAVTSSGAANGTYYNLPLWNMGSLNQPTRPVLLRSLSRDTLGNQRWLDYILYKVQFQPLKFDGPSYKNGLTVSYTGQALMSSVDERGNTLTDKSIGRLVSRPNS